MERRQQNPISNDRRGRLWRSMSTAGSASAGSGTREAPAKAMVMEQISQAVQSSANLLHLMQNSSPAQAKLTKLPKNLMAKVSTMKNTEQILEQLPRVISSLDAYMDNGLQNMAHLKTVVQLMENMQSRMNLNNEAKLKGQVKGMHVALEFHLWLKVIQVEKYVSTRDNVA
ncbi:tobamovirus multiplication protein 2B [Arachis duranensis]|uniref:Tobamovirus multiplication protein 2B n=1 Tax=Arachis duranensis TaxID=130453 RepID=A0A9C6TF45_ARADU|nr:tobamovirus multiplication protein 2B [Arachis duranensis]